MVNCVRDKRGEGPRHQRAGAMFDRRKVKVSQRCLGKYSESTSKNIPLTAVVEMSRASNAFLHFLLKFLWERNSVNPAAQQLHAATNNPPLLSHGLLI